MQWSRRAAMAMMATGLALCGSAFAQGYPERPVRLVVPYGPGSTPDVVGRSIAAKLQESMGQPVVVDNKVGAAGNIGIEHVARSAADGYTLLLAVSSVATLPWIQKPPFDIERDLTPVMLVISGSYVLLANPALPANSLAELVGLASASPGKLNYGSFGNGSQAHLAMEMLKNAAKIDVTHVPFKSLALATQATIAGQIDITFDASVSAIPQIRAGRLKALAVGGPRPLDALPDVPTIARTYPGFDADGWEGVFVPAGTPRPIIEKLNAELRKAMTLPDVAKRFRDLGFVPRTSTPEEFGAFLKAELAKWGKVVRENNIKSD